MLRGKSSSLPTLKFNLNKYDYFFTKKNHAKELAMQEEQQHLPDPQTDPKERLHEHPHLRNLDFISRKSSLRSKVDSYLSNSGKVGILDHAKNETNTRRSLTKMTLQSMKPVKTQTEYQLKFITKLKSELNFYTEKNKRMESSIRNCKALTTQVKEKVAYYEQLMNRSWTQRAQILDQRQENIVHVRYEADRLKFMQDRLKQIAIVMKKRVREAQAKLKGAQLEVKRLNEEYTIQQLELDNKRYLLKEFDKYQIHKTDELQIKTKAATKYIEDIQASRVVRKHQEDITIMDRQTYESELNQKGHNKLYKELLVQQFCSFMLNKAHTKNCEHYEAYQKAEKLIQMYSTNRDNDVQDTYQQSFQIKQSLEAQIKAKEAQLSSLQQKNKELNQFYEQEHFKEIQQIELKLKELKLEHKTDSIKLQAAQEKEQHSFEKSLQRREADIVRCRQLLIRLRSWIMKQEQSLELSISKRFNISEHFTILIDAVSKQLKRREPTFSFSQLKVKLPKKTSEKVVTKKKKK